MNTPGFTEMNKVTLIRGGQEYFEKLTQLIKTSATCIYLQFYIYDDDESGKMITAALKAAVSRGVAVYLLIDGYASQSLPRSYVNDMRKAGINFKWFAPFFKTKHFYFGRRLHHKVVVADGLYSLVGGSNICNRYNDINNKPAWLDFSLYCEGEASYELHKICTRMWNPQLNNSLISEKSISVFCNAIPPEESLQVKVIRNDWVKRKSEITNTYKSLIANATDHIIIMCSYFIPGRSIRKLISAAVKRGIKIKLILAGRSDVMIAKHAERFLYRWLLKHNIEIFEYQPTVLHAKVACIDNVISTVGSYNLNNISAYASLELNLVIKNEKFNKALTGQIEKIIATDCIQITKENYSVTTNIFRLIWQRICFSFINNVLNLITFYFKQEKE